MIALELKGSVDRPCVWWVEEREPLGSPGQLQQLADLTGLSACTLHTDPHGLPLDVRCSPARLQLSDHVWVFDANEASTLASTSHRKVSVTLTRPDTDPDMSGRSLDDVIDPDVSYRTGGRRRPNRTRSLQKDPHGRTVSQGTSLGYEALAAQLAAFIGQQQQPEEPERPELTATGFENAWGIPVASPPYEPQYHHPQHPPQPQQQQQPQPFQQPQARLVEIAPPQLQASPPVAQFSSPQTAGPQTARLVEVAPPPALQQLIPPPAREVCGALTGGAALPPRGKLESPQRGRGMAPWNAHDAHRALVEDLSDDDGSSAYSSPPVPARADILSRLTSQVRMKRSSPAATASTRQRRPSRGGSASRADLTVDLPAFAEETESRLSGEEDECPAVDGEVCGVCARAGRTAAARLRCATCAMDFCAGGCWDMWHRHPTRRAQGLHKVELLSAAPNAAPPLEKNRYYVPTYFHPVAPNAQEKKRGRFRPSVKADAVAPCHYTERLCTLCKKEPAVAVGLHKSKSKAMGFFKAFVQKAPSWVCLVCLMTRSDAEVDRLGSLALRLAPCDLCGSHEARPALFKCRSSGLALCAHCWAFEHLAQLPNHHRAATPYPSPLLFLLGLIPVFAPYVAYTQARPEGGLQPAFTARPEHAALASRLELVRTGKHPPPALLPNQWTQNYPHFPQEVRVENETGAEESDVTDEAVGSCDVDGDYAHIVAEEYATPRAASLSPQHSFGSEQRQAGRGRRLNGSPRARAHNPFQTRKSSDATGPRFVADQALVRETVPSASRLHAGNGPFRKRLPPATQPTQAAYKGVPQAQSQAAPPRPSGPFSKAAVPVPHPSTATVDQPPPTLPYPYGTPAARIPEMHVAERPAYVVSANAGAHSRPVGRDTSTQMPSRAVSSIPSRGASSRGRPSAVAPTAASSLGIDIKGVKKATSLVL
eukprot:TRINITY_DN2050_c1_g1_i2.p1 TRINITY_DN2050_c1_g1~~TRINITY_DN2050_c1_g1_i2.p1  ORF type:complete len:937 (+),score=141.25 TRINITY_DN2050_c1_g1_i2:104-2914(+)